MRYVKLGDSYMVRLDSDEPIVAGLAAFAADRRIDAGSVAGIGSAHDVELGYFDRQSCEFVRRRIDGDVDVTSLVGNLTLKDGRPYAHVYATLSDRRGQVTAGRLFEARVAATCELVVRPLAGFVQRVRDAESGLHLLDL